MILMVSLIPLQTADALSLAYIVSRQDLTIELAPDGSAKIEDRLDLTGPAGFEMSYVINQPGTMKKQLSPNTTTALNLDKLNLDIEVVNLETGDTQPVEASDEFKENHYYAYARGDAVYIDLQMTDHGYEYGLVFRYEFDNFVTTYEDAAVIEPLKTPDGLLQNYTDASVRVILPGGLDYSVTPESEDDSEGDSQENSEGESEEASQEDQSKDEASDASTTESEDATETPATSQPVAPEVKPSSDEMPHFSEKLPGDLWAWFFYADQAQLTLTPGEEQTVMQIHLPNIGLGELTEVQIATPIDRFPDNPNEVPEKILDELIQKNQEKMDTAEPYEDFW